MIKILKGKTVVYTMAKGVDSLVDRNGVQVGFNISPQSRFVVLACFWISSVSVPYLGYFPKL